MPSLSVSQAFQIALQHHQAGRLAEAEMLYRQILTAAPHHPEAMHHLGIVACQMGRHSIGLEWFQQALSIAPENANAHFNLGDAYRELGRLEEAAAEYRRAIGIQPNDPPAHHNLGRTLMEQGRTDAAICALQRAVELQPDFPEAWVSLGTAMVQVGRHVEAVAKYERAIELRPDYAEAHNNLGLALATGGQPEEALAAYRRALELQPTNDKIYNNLGIALTDLGRGDEAISSFRRAIALNPRYPEALNNLGNAFRDRGQLEEAVTAYRTAMPLAPDPSWVQSNLIYTLHFLGEENSSLLADEQVRWNRRLSKRLQGTAPPHGNGRNPERRLRIGYVSPDIRSHVIGRNLMPLFRSHDRQNFEIICYSGVVRSDEVTEAFRKMTDRWRSTLGVADEDLAETIRQDGVDILVDLIQHLAGNRLAVFVRKPAPVQVSFAGYPESTGLEAIGYRISDRWLEAGASLRQAQGRLRMGDRSLQFGVRSTECEDGRSAMEDGKWKMEKDLATGAVALQLDTAERVYLIDSFWCYDPCGMEVAVNELPAQENGRITFGSLNNFCKVNDLVLQLWARVLGVVKNSRLILLSGFGSHRQRTVDFLAQHGVEPERVEFVAPCPRKDYLELYHRLDIALDPFPYGGHTTSLDAVWMGVPVVSLAGERAVSRAGLSILSNLGLPELVAFSEEAYVDIAIRLAGDVPRLEELRRSLRSRMEGSVLMDGERFARQIEAAYRAMWRRWCAK